MKSTGKEEENYPEGVGKHIVCIYTLPLAVRITNMLARGAAP